MGTRSHSRTGIITEGKLTFPQRKPAFRPEASYAFNHAPGSIRAAYWNHIFRLRAFFQHRMSDNVTLFVGLTGRSWWLLSSRVCKVGVVLI